MGLDLPQPRQPGQPAVEPGDIRPPSAREVAALLDSVASADPALGTYLRLAATTGARRSQLLALRWADIDLERAAIGYTRALVEGPTGPVLRPTKTRRSYRVALDSATVRALDEHLARCRAQAAQAGAELPARGFVFSPDPDGSRPWVPNRVTRQFSRARRHAGLSHFRLHDLRQFMATTLLAAGVPVATVSARLGHARGSTTLNVYAHVIPGADDHAAELVSHTLTQTPKPTPNPAP